MTVLIHHHARALGIALMVMVAEIHGQAPAQRQTGPTPGSSLLTGSLPNGVAYAILPRRHPKADTGLRLIVHTGSMDERDDERGFANFVAHMASSGTRHYPSGRIRHFVQDLGLSAGADFKTETSYTHTHYVLDLPEGGIGRLDEGLRILRDCADGLLFPPERVPRVAQAILDEIKASDSASQRINAQRMEVMFAGTLAPAREVNGVPEDIERATPDKLRAFYQRNYLPARMTVVLVGPVDQEAAVKLVNTAFGSMNPVAENRPPASTPKPPPPDNVKCDVRLVPTFEGGNVRFSSIRERAADTVNGRRRELAQRIAMAILLTRIGDRQEREELDQFGQVGVRSEPTPFGQLVEHWIGIPCTSSAWPDAVQVAESELRRARAGSFTKTEIEEAAACQLANARNRAADASLQTAALVATEVAGQIVEGRKWQTPVTELMETTNALRDLTPAEVTAEIDHLFPINSLHVVLLITPNNPVKPEQLLAAYAKSAERKIKIQTGRTENLRFRYEDWGQAGTITKHERIDELGLTLVSFANGVKLNVRPSTFEPERFRLRVVFAQSYSDVPIGLGGIPDLATHFLLNSNFGRQRSSEIARLLEMRGIGPQFSIDHGTVTLEIVGPSMEAPFALRYLTVLLSDILLDEKHYRGAVGNYGTQYRTVSRDPRLLALRAAVLNYTGNDSRVALKPPQFFANVVRFGDTRSWLLDHILNGPLEIGIVGDIVLDDVMESAATSIGTLKRRRTPRSGEPLSSPSASSRQEGSAEIPASASVACVLWPISSSSSPLETAALALATDALREREVQALSETPGEMRVPEAQIHRDAVQRDFSFISLTTPFETATARQMSYISLSVAAHFAEKGASDEEFTRLRESARARNVHDVHSNSWWLANVAVAQSRPETLNELRQHEKIFDKVTLDDVNRAARIFKSDRCTWILLHPSPAKSPPEHQN